MRIMMKINDVLTLVSCATVALYCGSHGFFHGDWTAVAAGVSAVFASATAHT